MDSRTLILFHNLNRETLEIEYKEFSYKIHVDKYYDIDEINKIVLGKTKLDSKFNQSILDNIKFYSKYYIPKYISAFCNGQLEKNGKLIIGVDDLGEIVGIPFLGNIPKESIRNYIIRQIHDSIITTNATMNYLLENIKINIEKLEIKEELIYSNLEKSLEKIHRLTQIFLKERDEYQLVYRNWYKKLSRYAQKLVDLVKIPDILKELVCYIAERDSTKLIVLTQDFEEEAKNIHIEKYNPNNIVYWVCKFRDDKVDEIISERPIKPKTRPKKVSYTHEFLKLGNLRKTLLENNSSLNYYLVVVEIPNGCLDEVFYRDSCGNIIKKTRIMECGEPICR